LGEVKILPKKTMKRATLFNFFVATLLFATAATGCKKNPKNITPINSPRMGLPGSDSMAGPIDPALRLDNSGARGMNLGGSTEQSAIGDPLLNANEDRATLASQTIYFDYDRSAVKASEQGKLDAVATYMKSTPGVQLRIEGNCDERGTEEYNRSLGERRAISARDYLIQKHGIESGRITTLSNGEDKPVEIGKTEEAYAKNRRDDFVILSPR
jgi:peptidoglycan-associated lipoprotein